MASVCFAGTVQGFFFHQLKRYEVKCTNKGAESIELPAHLQKHYFILRLTVEHKVARLEEIRQFWDINDVMRANELLDIQQDAEWLAHQKTNAQMNHGRP